MLLYVTEAWVLTDEEGLGLFERKIQHKTCDPIESILAWVLKHEVGLGLFERKIQHKTCAPFESILNRKKLMLTTMPFNVYVSLDIE